MKSISILFLFLIVGCGAPEKEEEKEIPEEEAVAAVMPKGAMKIQVGRRDLYIEKKYPLDLDCNLYFLDYVLTSKSKSCRTVAVDQKQLWNEPDLTWDTKWTIQTPDNDIDLEAYEREEREQVVIEGQSYFCYRYGGSTFDPKDGDENVFGSMMFLVSHSLEDSDDLEGANIFLTGTSDAEVCDDIH